MSKYSSQAANLLQELFFIFFLTSRWDSCSGFGASDNVKAIHRDCTVPSLTQLEHFLTDGNRHLADDNTTSTCSICNGAGLLEDTSPIYTFEIDELANLTCAEIDSLVESLSPTQCSMSGVSALYSQCCIGNIPRYQCATDIRRSILEDYDPAVAPMIDRNNPLDIYVDMTYQTVIDIDVQKGTATIFLSLNLIWQDPRLAWSMNESACADYVYAYASLDREDAEIWVPPVDLLNQVNGVQTLPDAMAIVYSDGTVLWNRNGGITAICVFQGLAQIPFDTLGCQLLIGSFIDPFSTDDLVRYQFYSEEGIQFGQFEVIYNEYLPVPELSKFGRVGDSGTLFYTFFFRRAKHFYIFNIVIPTTILTYVSFGTFLLDLRVGERLSYGMALALVVVAQQIVTSDLIPVSNEKLWIDKYVGWSFYWVVAGLVESVCVGYFFFKFHDSQESLESMDDNGKTIQTPDKHGGEAEHHVSQDHEALPQGADRNPPPSTPYYSKKREDGVGGASLKLSMQRRSSYGTPRRSTVEMSAASISLAQWFWGHVSLRWVDEFCFVLTIITYTIFVIAMFATVDRWGENTDISFFDENTTILGP